MEARKRFACFLAIAMIFGLAACNSSSQPSAPPADSNSSAAAPAEASGDDDPFIIAYIAKESKSSFHAILNGCAGPILDGMVTDGTISQWLFLDGQEDPLIQTSLMEDAINMGANLVILLPAEEDGSAPVVSRCAEEGIPCIVVNSKTSNTDELATAYITSNDVQAGEMMAKFVQEQFPDGGGYCHIQGVLGNSAQVQRGEGTHNIMDADSNWTMLAEQAGNWDPSKGVQFAEDWLNMYGDQINAIICDDDDTSAAVQVAMNAAGREDIVCIGVNGGATACALIDAGAMKGTVYQDGVGQMTKALEIAQNIASGTAYDTGTVIIDYAYITKDNVADYI